MSKVLVRVALLFACAGLSTTSFSALAAEKANEGGKDVAEKMRDGMFGKEVADRIREHNREIDKGIGSPKAEPSPAPKAK